MSDAKRYPLSDTPFPAQSMRYRMPTGNARADELHAKLNLLKIERRYSEICARRYRLAMWAVGWSVADIRAGNV
jgi:hypothetical protein